jgi:hypothetical protein
MHVSDRFLILKLNHMDEHGVVGPLRAVSGDRILSLTVTNTSALQDKNIFGGFGRV